MTRTAHTGAHTEQRARSSGSAPRPGRGVRARVWAPELPVDGSGRHPPSGWWSFERPVEVLRAEDPRDVPGLLHRVDAATRTGLWAVGFVGYEASSGFEPALRTHPAPAGEPVAWFGLFPAPQPWKAVAPRCAPEAGPSAGSPADPSGSVGSLRLVPTVSERAYLGAVRAILGWIAEGETYQANFTYRLRGRWRRPPGEAAMAGAEALFLRLAGDGPAPYGTYLDLGDGSAVCSASPELFFRRRGRSLLCRPMKGTAARGVTPGEDLAAAERLRRSPKERAENVMIVDMIRNDLGRIARPGSVRVDALFRVERYPTLFQMTSDVRAESDASLADLFGALFPCASITGAPKVRTMEILRELETTPRGVYTGALGYVAPGGDCRFSVAIRTARIGPCADDEGASWLEYGTGGGIVWDSDPAAELRETRTKALILSGPPPTDRSAEEVPRRRRPHQTRKEVGDSTPDRSPGAGGARLLETLLWSPPSPPGPDRAPRTPWTPCPWSPAPPPAESGYLLLEHHLDRLTRSAAELGFPVDLERLRGHLEALAARLTSAGITRPRRVRLLVGSDGHPESEVSTPPRASSPGDRAGTRSWRLAVARAPVDRRDPRLRHKTTDRRPYLEARRGLEELDDVILWNREGELTEATVANLVVTLDGELVTPPATAGLLPGTYRRLLLDRGVLRERRLHREDLRRAEALALVNSVRGWIPAHLAQPAEGASPRPETVRGLRIDSNRPTR